MAEKSLVEKVTSPEGFLSVGRQNLVSLGIGGAVKPFVEGLIAATPVGNSTVVSGLVKIVGGVVAHEVGASKIPILGNALVAALIMDGGEDLARGIASRNIFGGAAAAAAAEAGW